jgi:hypothetical protein
MECCGTIWPDGQWHTLGVFMRSHGDVGEELSGGVIQVLALCVIGLQVLSGRVGHSSLVSRSQPLHRSRAGKLLQADGGPTH